MRGLLVRCELPRRFSSFPIGSSSSPCVAPQPIVQATRRRSARVSPRIMIWTFQCLHARVDFDKRNAGATAKWSGPQCPASRPAMPKSSASSTNISLLSATIHDVTILSIVKDSWKSKYISWLCLRLYSPAFIVVVMLHENTIYSKSSLQDTLSYQKYSMSDATGYV